MLHIILALFPLVVLIALGYMLKQTRFLRDEFWLGAERLNYYILFPALFIHLLASARIEFSAVKSVMLAMLLVFLIASILLYGFKMVFRSPRARFGVHLQSLLRFNSYISLALVAALYQQQGMLILAMLVAVAVPVVNILAVLAFTETRQMNLRSLLWSLVKNPLISSCIFGVFLNILAIPMWQGLLDLLKLLSAASLPLGLLCVGAALQFQNLQKNSKVLVADTLLRLLAMPSMAYVLAKWLALSALETQVLVLFFALPTASAAYILTKVFKGDSQLMAAIISIQTLCAALTLPLVLFLMR